MKTVNNIIPANFITKKSGNTDVKISGIHYDSRKIKKNFMFFAIKGELLNGEDFIPKAIENGALIIVVDENSKYENLDCGIIKVKKIRQVLALASANIFDNAVSQLKLIGITGTNGKSTVVNILKSLLEKNHYKPATIGTIEYCYGDKKIKADRTTPESLNLHEHFYEMYALGHKSVVMEVSSHALALERVFGLNFEVGIFTNLTHEHLDFHKNMDDYFNQKAKLFISKNRMFKAVINIDDEYGKKLAAMSSGEIITYGINSTNSSIKLIEVDYSIKGTFLKISTPLGQMNITSSLIGKFNVYNTLACVGVGVAMGFTFENITTALQNIPQINGRCEKIFLKNSNYAVIDYAHTPDALKNICETLHSLASKRLIIVFGAGGNRDKEKRPIMGKIADDYGDIVFLTSDNPRNEDPQKIVDEIICDVDNKNKFMIEIDRKKAIHRALDMAGRGDVILVAGKGHEDYQEINGQKFHFDDHEIVNQWKEIN